MIIAIDGLAASGKGTVAKLVAGRLGFAYLDTGLLYRAAAYKAMQEKIAPEQAAARLTTTDMQAPALKTDIIGNEASKIAAMPAVRAALLDYQRAFAKNPKGAVLDGRDIGTVVCPNAPYKFFFTATPEIRAERRHKELLQLGEKAARYEFILADIIARDARDSSRIVAPLKPAPDAVIIDTTQHSIEEVLAMVLAKIHP